MAREISSSSCCCAEAGLLVVVIKSSYASCFITSSFGCCPWFSCSLLLLVLMKVWWYVCGFCLRLSAGSRTINIDPLLPPSTTVKVGAIRCTTFLYWTVLFASKDGSCSVCFWCRCCVRLDCCCWGEQRAVMHQCRSNNRQTCDVGNFRALEKAKEPEPFLHRAYLSHWHKQRN